jgi:hypothetical protein
MRRTVLGLLILVATGLAVCAVPPSASADFGRPRPVSPRSARVDDWVTATDAAGRTAYVFRTRRGVDLRLRRVSGRLAPVVSLGRGPLYPFTPQVSLDREGHGAVVWGRAVRSRLRWQVREFGTDGSLRPTRTPVPAHSQALDLRAEPLPGGRTVVTWTGSTPGGRRAFLRVLTPGGHLGPVRALGRAAQGVAPWVLPRGPRRAEVVWTDAGAVVGRMLRGDGPPSPRVRLRAAHAHESLTLSAAASGAHGGALLVGSRRDDQVNHVCLFRISGHLTPEGPLVDLSPDSQDVGINGEGLAVGTSGAGAVTWYDADTSASYAVVLRADGTVGPLTSLGPSQVGGVAVRAKGDGAILLHRYGRHHPIRLVRIHHGAVRGKGESVSVPASVLPDSSLAVLPRGRFLVSYGQFGSRHPVLLTSGR